MVSRMPGARSPGATPSGALPRSALRSRGSCPRARPHPGRIVSVDGHQGALQPDWTRWSRVDNVHLDQIVQFSPADGRLADVPCSLSPVHNKRGDQLKFLLQIRFNGADAVIGELSAEEQQQVTTEFIAIRKAPGVLDGNQLQDAGEAVTVRVTNGQPR